MKEWNMDSFGGIQSQVRTTMSNINTLDVVDENGVREGRDEDEKRFVGGAMEDSKEKRIYLTKKVKE